MSEIRSVVNISLKHFHGLLYDFKYMHHSTPDIFYYTIYYIPVQDLIEITTQIYEQSKMSTVSKLHCHETHKTIGDSLCLVHTT